MVLAPAFQYFTVLIKVDLKKRIPAKGAISSILTRGQPHPTTHYKIRNGLIVT